MNMYVFVSFVVVNMYIFIINKRDNFALIFDLFAFNFSCVVYTSCFDYANNAVLRFVMEIGCLCFSL